MDNVYQNDLYLFVCGKFPVKIEIIRPFPGFNRLHKPLPSVASLYSLSPSFQSFFPRLSVNSCSKHSPNRALVRFLIDNFGAAELNPMADCQWLWEPLWSQSIDPASLFPPGRCLGWREQRMGKEHRMRGENSSRPAPARGRDPESERGRENGAQRAAPHLMCLAGETNKKTEKKREIYFFKIKMKGQGNTISIRTDQKISNLFMGKLAPKSKNSRNKWPTFFLTAPKNSPNALE